MDTGSSEDTVLFECFRLDRRSRTLFRRTPDFSWEPINLGSRARGVLCALIDRNGDVVSKCEIMATVWPTTVVEEANLTVQISTLRRVLDQDRVGNSCIETVPGRGYRFAVAVSRSTEQETPGPARSAPPVSGSRLYQQPKIMAVAVVLAIFFAINGWWIATKIAPAAISSTAPDATHDRRRAVIVLPFENSSGDPAEDGLADNLTRSVTNRLALGRIGPIIPETTVQAYRGQTAAMIAIAAQSGARFVIAGNVHRQEQRLIASATIYETPNGRVVWSGRVDRPDGPDALASVTQVIYENCDQSWADMDAELALHSDQPDARALMSIVLSTQLSTPTKAHYLKKIALVDRVLALKPDDFQGLERKARLHADFVLLGYSSDPTADLTLARQAVDRMFVIDPNGLLALRAKASLLRAQGDWAGAEFILRKTIGLQPTEAMRYFELGQVLMAQGRHEEALASLLKARQFAGGTDPVYSIDANIAMADLALGRSADAIDAAQASIWEFPPDAGRIGELPWLALIAATSASGDASKARANLQRFLSRDPNWQSLAKVRSFAAFAANPMLLDGLRQAGMPLR
jgi:DNA-binding winged helix-turn-helix (wHTH) protein/TolB-like protein